MQEPPVISVERRRRRTAAIIVYPDDRVRVIVPLRMADRQVDAFVKEKAHWIERRLRINREDRERTPTVDFIAGSKVLFLGEELTLDVQPGRGQARGTSDRITLFVNGTIAALPDHSDQKRALIKSKLAAFYKKEARAFFQDAVARRWQSLQQHVGAFTRLRRLGKVSLKDMKTRWGSCSSEGNISLNWRVILAPPSVVDYLIVHELCHLVHQNHSRAYWSLVASILPCYEEPRLWLRKNARRLDFLG